MPGFTRMTSWVEMLVRSSGGFDYQLLVEDVFVHSWREEFSIVKRAGNSCSPVRGSFLETDIL